MNTHLNLPPGYTDQAIEEMRPAKKRGYLKEEMGYEEKGFFQKGISQTEMDILFMGALQATLDKMKEELKNPKCPHYMDMETYIQCTKDSIEEYENRIERLIKE